MLTHGFSGPSGEQTVWPVGDCHTGGAADPADKWHKQTAERDFSWRRQDTVSRRCVCCHKHGGNTESPFISMPRYMYFPGDGRRLGTGDDDEFVLCGGHHQDPDYYHDRRGCGVRLECDKAYHSGATPHESGRDPYESGKTPLRVR